MSLPQKEQDRQPDLPTSENYDSQVGLSTIALEYCRLLETIEVTPFNEYVYQTSLELMSRLDLNPGFSHLDLACGNGRFLHRLQTDFYPSPGRLLGLDASQEMVAIANKKYPGLEIAVGDQQNAFPDQQEIADSITNLNGIHYLSNQAKVLSAYRTAYRLLKPGGFYLGCTSDDVCTAAWRGMSLDNLKKRIRNGRHPLSWTMPDETGQPVFRLRFYPYLNSEHESALKKAGFSDIAMFSRFPPSPEIESHNKEAHQILSSEPVFIFFQAKKPYN